MSTLLSRPLSHRSSTGDGTGPLCRTAGRTPTRTAAVVVALLVAALVVLLRPGGAVEPLPGGAAVFAPHGGVDLEHLRPAVRRAVERAVEAAAADGVELRVTSGWRSAEHQRRLHEEAVAEHGSEAAARQWVLPPEESEHVRGGAVDVGPARGATWLDAHGVRFGLCRRYDNEPWHFELLARADGSACPPREPHA